ncbi:MAG: hypothetical protein ACI4S3_10750 [Candidatus Gastranaerophilaceae bacterium]
MGVKPVEYKKDSSTQGFAVAGDEKVITKQNANTIKKDVDQGNTEDLDNAQSRCLENYVDYDNIEYSEEENKNVGRNQIDTKDTENTNGGQTTGAMGMSAAGVGAQAVSAVSGAVGSGAGSIAGYAQLSKQAATTAKIPWMALAAGGIDLGIGTAAIISVNMFDDQYKSRIGQKDSAGDTNQIIQQYYDELTNNMDSMTADSVAYAAAAEKKFGESMALIDIIGEIDAQIIEYRAQGNEAKVAELMKQKEQYKKDAEVLNTDDPDGMGALKENIELYASRNAEAQGVSESGDVVSEFLRDGTQMGVLGVVNTGILIASGLLMLQGTIDAVKAAIKVPWPGNIAAGIVAVAGAAMMLAGNVLVLLAAKNMAGKAKNEFECASTGSEMAEYVAQLNENIDAQAGFTEETAAGYTAIDEAGAEELAKTQEGVDEANKGLAGAVGGTTSPDDGDKPDDKPDGNQPDGGNNPTA